MPCLTLFTVKLTNAQPTASTTPSIPEFTLKIVNNSRYTETITTTTTDPYTGQPTTSTTPSKYVQEEYIEVAIKNQTFTPYPIGGNYSSNLWFDVRYKGHQATDWKYANPNPYQDCSASYLRLQTYYNNLPMSGEIDFQVRAINGYQTHKDNLFPQTWIVQGQESGWSDIQTINLESGAVTITPYINPSPTQTQTAVATPTPSVPEMPALMILPLFLATVAIALIIKHRKG